MSESSFSGQIGLVLLPDRDTRDRALQIAREFSVGNSIKLGTIAEPHISLYHSKLSNVPGTVIDEYLKECASRLPLPLTFTTLSTFGEKFLFWNIEKDEQLLSLHESALQLSAYFVPEGEQQPDRENVILSEDEKACVAQYGHPRVGALWQPHITLGYFSESLPTDIGSQPFSGAATGVAFVRIGEAGTISEILMRR